jgi:hypothetical protein
MLVITRLRRAFGITALARFTKSRGSETLTTSYCRRSVDTRGYLLIYMEVCY